jgi:hypothetical protein
MFKTPYIVKQHKKTIINKFKSNILFVRINEFIRQILLKETLEVRKIRVENPQAKAQRMNGFERQRIFSIYKQKSTHLKTFFNNSILLYNNV